LYLEEYKKKNRISNLIEINIAKLNQGKYFVKVVYTDGSSDIEQLIKV